MDEDNVSTYYVSLNGSDSNSGTRALFLEQSNMQVNKQMLLVFQIQA